MQQIFLTWLIFHGSVGFATNLLNLSIAQPNKTTLLVTTPKIPTKPPTTDGLATRRGEAHTTESTTPSPRKELEADTKLSTVVMSTKSKIKLNAKQNLILNQVVGIYALSGLKDSACKNHTLEYKTALRNFEPWALKMFDSSSKLQAGIFMGNLMDYGSFRQCVDIFVNTNSGPIRGQHCTIRVTPNDDLTQYIMSYRNISKKRFKKVRMLMLGAGLVWSVCLPASCTHDDILPHFNKTILSVTEGLTLNISLGKFDCYTVDDEPPLGEREWMVIFAFFVLVVTTLICTAIDVRAENTDGPKYRAVKVFSAYTNVKKMLAVRAEKQPLDCLNGIRFLSMCYVVAGHTYLMSMFFPLINALNIMDWVLKYPSTIIIGGTVCVDTFFMLTGLLVTYTFFDQMSRGAKFNLPLFYLHRYLRVTPALMAVALVHATLIQHLGSGPLWKKTIRPVQKSCQYFWWAAMLHIQSYVNAPLICILPTWYMTCDTLYYFLSPMVIYPMWKWPIAGLILLIFVYVLSVAVSFYVAWANRFDAMGLQSNQFLRTSYFKHHYIAPHTRVSPFILGVALGYFLFKTKDENLKMSLPLVLFGWACSLGLMSAALLGTHPFQLEGHDYNRMENSLFLSCSRSAWTLGVAWMVWACRHGYGGPIDYILSFPTYQILARLSYPTFLIHMGTQFLMQGASKSPGYFSNFIMIYKFFGDILICLFLAFLFTLFIESPIIAAERLLLKRLAAKNERVTPLTSQKQRNGQKANCAA